MLKDREFIKGQIYVMERRLAKAQRRIERYLLNEEKGLGPAGKHIEVEQERAHRLSKLIALHKSDPDEALKLYK